MSKPKMVVLGFLRGLPMHGYQIGHVVEKLDIPSWSGIRLPSIYKALQDLESTKHIRGEQVTEGNNPPRTVFHINDKGRELHSELVRKFLSSADTANQDWWLALSFAGEAVSAEFLEKAIENRIQSLNESNHRIQTGICQQMLDRDELPFVIRHILQLERKYHRAEIKTLKDLLVDVHSPEHRGFFQAEGEKT